MHLPGAADGWEQLFWLVFGRSANPIVLLDEQRRIVEVNEPALALLGRPREQLIGSSIVASIRPDERKRAAQDWQDFLRTGEYSGRRVLLRGDGTEMVVDFAARLAEVHGRHLAIYVVIADPPGAHDPQLRSASEIPLTARERDVVTLIALGHETNEIAEQLGVSAETVRTHVRNAMAKLGAHTRAQLVAIALCSERTVARSRLGP